MVRAGDAGWILLYCPAVLPSELDAEKLDVLRRWGGGLEVDGREEVAAAGRAILLLIEEIERLHVLLWERTLYPPAVPGPDVEAQSVAGHTGETLSERLRRGGRL